MQMCVCAHSFIPVFEWKKKLYRLMEKDFCSYLYSNFWKFFLFLKNHKLNVSTATLVGAELSAHAHVIRLIHSIC